MGSSSKQKHRDRESTNASNNSASNSATNSSGSRKRRHQSGPSEDRYEQRSGDSAASREVSASREKRHKHRKHHHREKKREKQQQQPQQQEYASSDSDVVEVVPISEETSAPQTAVHAPPPPPDLRQSQQAPENAGDGQSRSSLSIEQTNRMRAKLGLKPLQVGATKVVKKPEPEPVIDYQSHDSLSISGTNQLRAKLGLKPLQVGTTEATSSSTRQEDVGEPDGKLQDDLGEFYHRPAGNIAAAQKAEKIKAKLDERKARRAIESKLSKIKSLGSETATTVDDPRAWVARSRHTAQARTAAAHRAAYLDALDAQFGIGEVVQQRSSSRQAKAYGERHLHGLRVQHDMSRFADREEGGRPVVLTLKDQGVLDEGEDVLVNVNMVDDERYERSNLNKKRKLPHEFDENDLDEFGNPLPQSILGKYDEDLDGNKPTNSDHFIIGKSTSSLYRKTNTNSNTTGANTGSSSSTIREKLAESLLSNLTVASEYYNEEEMATFKKPKKMRKKTMRKKGSDDIKGERERWIEGVGTRRPQKGGGGSAEYDDTQNINTDDIKLDEDNDDQLERALNKARRLKLLERKDAVPNMEDILSQIRPEIKEEEEEEEGDLNNYTKDASNTSTTLNASSIILNSTAEFCRTLGDIPTYGRSGNREDDITTNTSTDNMADPDVIDSYIKPASTKTAHRMITMELDDNADAEQGGVDMDVDDDDVQIMETDGRGQSRWSSVDAAGGSGDNPGDKPILDEEPDVGSGVGAALKLAMSKGYLDKDEDNRPSNTRLAHLQAKHYSIEDKAYGEGGDGERPGRRGGNAAAAQDHRYCGPVQDFKEKDTFRPNVKLEYIDDDGHILNAKEAFRYLSHKFHGKGPGKNKVEKRIKKGQQEGLMKKMSSTDTPLGTLNMLQAKQKEMQSAYIVLSGGKNSHSTTISKARRQ